VEHDDDDDVVEVGIGTPDVETPVNPGSDGNGNGNGNSSGGTRTEPTLPNDCTEGWWRNPTTGQIDTWIDPATGDIMADWQFSCPGVLVIEPRRMRAATPADLIPGFYGSVLARIQPPVSAISPPDRAPFNLGLWLATDGPTEIVESGPVGPFTVSVIATLADTTFDMGDGTVVACPGGGVPISDLDTIDEGPCGHTYTEDLPDGAAIAMQGRWEIRYETTIGSGNLGDIHTESALPYETYEIQTVGGERD
jgi:hypothetical protein